MEIDGEKVSLTFPSMKIWFQLWNIYGFNWEYLWHSMTFPVDEPSPLPSLGPGVISQLLERTPELRLGASSRGAKEPQ